MILSFVRARGGGKSGQDRCEEERSRRLTVLSSRRLDCDWSPTRTERRRVDTGGGLQEGKVAGRQENHRAGLSRESPAAASKVAQNKRESPKSTLMRAASRGREAKHPRQSDESDAPGSRRRRGSASPHRKAESRERSRPSRWRLASSPPSTSHRPSRGRHQRTYFSDARTPVDLP